jgi:hypothetical protein
LDQVVHMVQAARRINRVSVKVEAASVSPPAGA